MMQNCFNCRTLFVKIIISGFFYFILHKKGFQALSEQQIFATLIYSHKLREINYMIRFSKAYSLSLIGELSLN